MEKPPSGREGAPSAVGAVILAAGASSRMGTPKQAVTLEGQTLLRRAALAALAAGCSPVVVVTGANAGRSREQLLGLDVLEAENAGWESGMGSSVRTGVRALLDVAPGVDALILMVCDQPFVTPGVLGRLAEARRRTGSPVVASRYGDGFGVPALFAAERFEELLGLADGAGAKAVIAKYSSEAHFVDFPRGEIDVDTPEDLDRVRSAGVRTSLEKGETMADSLNEIPAYAAQSPTEPLGPFSISRREPGPHDVLIDILYCGVCHTDVHLTRDEWGGSTFPMVPGHEILGRVARAGAEVTKFQEGDVVGVGCFVDSCRECDSCRAGEEQYCEQGMTSTYNAVERDGATKTYGGYSTRITVDENYLLRIPDGIPLERAAPLLCAGITTYSPLRQFGVKAGDSVAVVGLGGLGHMGVKLAKAMGAKVTVLSTSPNKRDDALRLGADDLLATRDPEVFVKNAGRFRFILDTISAQHDYNAYLGLLERDGTMVLLGVPPEPTPLSASPLIMGRRRLAGSLIGGIQETQEMLDFCAEHGVASDVEVIPIQEINGAYERMIKGDVRYRFVIDVASLARP